MRMRLVLVGLLAVCAFSLVGVASASAALPEFVPKESGKFPSFHGLIEGSNELTTTGGSTIKCSNVHVVGQFLDAHLGDIHLLFLSCETTVSGLKGPCGNKPAAASKEILLEGLFHLGYIEPSTKLVGVLVNTDKAEKEIVSFECEVFGIKETIKVTGEVVGHIPNADRNTSLHELTVEFKQVSVGKQEYQQITLPLVSETELMTGVHLTSHHGSSTEEAAQNSPPGNLLLLPVSPTQETGEIKA